MDSNRHNWRFGNDFLYDDANVSIIWIGNVFYLTNITICQRITTTKLARYFYLSLGFSGVSSVYGAICDARIDNVVRAPSWWQAEYRRGALMET